MSGKTIQTIAVTVKILVNIRQHQQQKGSTSKHLRHDSEKCLVLGEAVVDTGTPRHRVHWIEVAVAVDVFSWGAGRSRLKCG